MFLMKSRSLLTLTALASAGFAFGQATTNPVGYVTIECKANSDTIVGVPLRQSAAFVGSLNGAPDTETIPDSAILTLSGTPGLTVDTFANTHYVKFTNTEPTPAAGDGQWFVVTSNTSDTLTVDLNGGNIAAVSGAGLEVIKFWTLAELFDPSVCTTNPVTTGNAIVASLNTNLIGRRTSVIIPNYAGTGINRSASTLFFVNGSIWKEQGQGDANRGSFQLWPDTYVIIRHAPAVTVSTYYTISGEVELGEFDISLPTQASASRDTFVSLPRPVDVSLNSLNLGGTSAFLSSLNTNLIGRRDQLLVFNYESNGINKSVSNVYFYHSGIWKAQGDGDNDHGNDVIPAGAGFIIRKYRSGTGETANWANSSTY